MLSRGEVKRDLDLLGNSSCLLMIKMIAIFIVMLAQILKTKFDPLVFKAAKVLRLSSLSPNMLTFLGVIANLGAAFLIAYGKWGWAGFLVLIGGMFDVLDGAIARINGKTTSFGAFFDSVMDRFSDFLLFIAFAFYYATKGDIGKMLLTMFSMMGSIMVPFCRARAEVFISSCKVGWLERPERVILITIALFSGWIVPILWVILVFSFLTVLQRIRYTYQMLSEGGR